MSAGPAALPWSFSAKCPNQHLATQDEMDRDTLRRRLLRNEPIRLYCSRCGTWWEATERQRASLDFALGGG